MPSGNDDVKNTVDTNTTGTGPAVEVTAPVDYSIQPGNGGWGMVMQWMGFERLNKSLVFYTRWRLHRYAGWDQWCAARRHAEHDRSAGQLCCDFGSISA